MTPSLLLAQLGDALANPATDGSIDIPVPDAPSISVSIMDLLNAYAPIFLTAFAITVFSTPLVRRIAIAAGVVDHPDDPRKVHKIPVAYLGGVAVFLGILGAIAASYLSQDAALLHFGRVPIAIVVGMVAITFTGLADDIWDLHPRVKISGQLIAAAALAIEDVGVRVADGLLTPLLGGADDTLVIIFDMQIFNGDIYYWVGTALVAFFVLGGCNAANLLDGLDGLLSGVTGVIAFGLLVVSIMMIVRMSPEDMVEQADSLAGTRVALCLAVLGAVMGFLPHNFNPAAIFLGDCGSLLLGYMSVVIILMLGELGETHLVFAGLIIFALPIMDTTLAIIRRFLAGTPLSTGDSHHIHHQFKRFFGTVKRAVIALYGLAGMFAIVGVSLAALVMFTEMRVRVIYALAFVLFAIIGVTAVKAARITQVEQAALQTGKTGRPTSSKTQAPRKPTKDQPKTTSSKPASSS